MNLATKRAMRLITVLSGWLLFDLSFGHVVSRMDDSGLLDADGTVASILVLVFLGMNALFPIFLIYYRHKRRAQWIREEADEWLVRRSSRHKGKWSRRIRAGVLSAPSAIALSVFLFLPQSMGVFSNLFSSRTVVLNKHHVTVPWTAFNRSYPSRYLGALVGRGIAQVGLLQYGRMEPPFSSIFIYVIDDPTNPHWYEETVSPQTASSERTLPFGDETLTCREITSESDLQSNLVDVKCIASKHDVIASFYGVRHDVALFYQIIEKATN